MDAHYFRNYCGYGPYAENYLQHSGIEHCIDTLRRFRIPVRSALVLGAATGEVLGHFERAFGVRPHGCELSAWAHARIPARYRRQIRRADLRSYVPRLLAARRRFDVLFTNALIYLEASEIPALLEQCSQLCGHLHFYTSTREAFEAGDRYRVTLRSRRWWEKRLRENGFTRTRSPYLWRSL